MNRKISFKEAFLLAALASLCFLAWLKLGYPQFAFVDLSVDREQALGKAREFLAGRGIQTGAYSKAAAFSIDAWEDRYLQRTLGFRREDGFLRKYRYELFHWKVRFFREFQKEEFVLTLSPASGEVLSFKHLIEDIEPRKDAGLAEARNRAESFLKDFYRIEERDYAFHEEKTKRFENRTDYTFSWERKDVSIPWRKDQGQAKLLAGCTVSGDEVREFYKNDLDVPEKFRREIENQLMLGEYLYGFYFLIYVFLLSFSIYILLKGVGVASAGRLSKRFFLSLALFLLVINLFSILNNIQNIVIHYRTGVSFASFMGVFTLKEVVDTVFLTFAFVLPGIAGESLCFGAFPDKPFSSFAPFLRSSFLSRAAGRSILLGYLLFFILLGTQAVLFYAGQKTLGVWKEWIRLTELSSAFVPFLSIFAVSITAGFSEEVTFRLFGINLGKKYLKNSLLAILLTSFVWGLGHSTYAIFPVWFRCLEVGLLGVIYGTVFLRYGLLPLITAHYLFDAFLGAAGYLFGHAKGLMFAGSLSVLLLPLLFASIGFLAGKKEEVVIEEGFMGQI
jgi:membrane protease YdiL (CAAX protease family)